VVRAPIHHPDTNALTLPAVDPRSAEPNFKQCAVRLARPVQESDAPAAEVSGDD
jgi:assimilatory nitrate reductase catalytic subunit